MKKLVVLLGFLVVIGVTDYSWAAATCNSPIILGFDGNQDPDDDEFLYASETEFQKTETGYTNTGNQNSGSGYGYECDEIRSPSCGCLSTITLNKGHVFKGQVINRKVTYQCICGLDDYWTVVNDGICHTKGFGDINVGGCVTENGKCRVLTNIDCSGYTQTDNSAIEFQGICREGPTFVCKATKCKSGMKVNGNGICVADSSQQPTCGSHKNGDKWSVSCDTISIANGKTCGCRCNSDGTTTCYVTECAKGTLTDEIAPSGEYKGKYKKCTVASNSNPGNGGGNGGGSERVGKCHPSVCVSDICKACCAKPASETIWDRTGQACQCVNGGTFVNENGQWVCKIESNSPVVSTYNCDTTLMGKMAGWKVQCAKNSDVLALITDLETYCSGKPNESVFLRLYDEVKTNVATCGTPVLGDDDDTDAQLSAARGKITKSASTLKSMSEGFKVSVWKNKEGNFNTARLASDSIAGVVLGTAGGLITSNVVKKNQVKSGFEDIQCTIGGQVVADWGDEFRVGIQ